MRPTALATFLFGVTLGIGITAMTLFTQKPDRLATALGTVAAMGKDRRAREEAKRVRREQLKTVGFTDEEIEEIL